jgi:hypothetical protein
MVKGSTIVAKVISIPSFWAEAVGKVPSTISCPRDGF